MHSLLAKASLVLYLLILANAQSCSPSPSADKISTGSYTFQLAPFSSRLQCYNFLLDSAFLNSEPQITAGLSSISNFQGDSSAIDFSLRAYKILGSTQASFTLIVNNGTWTSVAIRYMISLRPDFLIGSYISSSNSLANCNKQQPYTLTILLPPTKFIENTQSLAVLIFLNGIRSQSTGLNLQFLQPVFDSSLKQINVTAVTNANKEIELIYFAYVLVDLNKLSTAGYSYSFSTTPINGDFLISGMVGFNTATQTQQIAFFNINKTNSLTCVGFTCNTCLSATSCTATGGQVSGTQCIKCTGGQAFINGIGCTCSSGMNLINGICGTCPAGTSYTAATQTCTIICPSNSYLSGTICICNQGYYNISGVCQTCPSGTQYNALTGLCVTTCSSNQIWSNGACNCITGYTKINGVCQQVTASCGTNKYLSSGVCKCLPNLLAYQGACYQCPTNSAVTTDQTGCMCLPGYTLTQAYTCQITSVNIVQSTTGASSTGTSGSSSSTQSLYGGTTSTSSVTVNTVSTSGGSSGSTSVCSTGSYYTNGTCRSQANITTNQSVLILNAVYVNIRTFNLPDSITNNNCPNCNTLVNASIVGNPTNVSVAINFIPGTSYQWVVAIVYQKDLFTVTLSLQFNPFFSTSFTTTEMSKTFTTTINPNQVPVYSLPAQTLTNSLTSQQELLTSEDPVPSQVLIQFKKTK